MTLLDDPRSGDGANPQQSLYQLVKYWAEVTPDTGVIGAPGRRTLTYRGLAEQTEIVLHALRNLGLERSDRIALVLPNGPEMAVAFIAVASAAACAPLNPAYKVNEFDFYLSDLNARLLMILSGMDSPAREVARKRNIPILEITPVSGAEAGRFELPGIVKTNSKVLDFSMQDDTALVLHTSGTTSRPKIVPLSHRNLCTSARNISATLQLTPEDRCLNIMPLFHIHGLVGAVLSSVNTGASVYCTGGLDITKFFSWIEGCKPTWYTAVPTMHQAILSRVQTHCDVLARNPLRFIRSSSAALPEKVMAQLEAVFGAPVIESYGMTEAAHQMASNPLPPLPRKAGSVGIAAGPDVAIMDEFGDLLSTGELGEVVIRGMNVTSGYENNATANRSAFTNGWFRTGDQGRFDCEGYLFLTGRLKEMINRGGEKIAPKEVDEALGLHPAVALAVAFSVPHPTLGEDVVAAVVLKDGVSVEESELRAFAATRLADYKVPTQILIVDEIPKGPTGKLQRIGLADKLGHVLARKQESNFSAAKSSAEEQLVVIWKQVLNVKQVGTRDNFYVLGGDSLLTLVLMNEVERHLGVRIPLEDFLRSPTVETLARRIEGRDHPSVGENGLARGQNKSTPIRDSCWKGLKNRVCQLLALYIPGYTTSRVWLHRMRGVAIGKNVSIGLSAIIETAYPELVSIGDNVTIGMRAIIIGHLRDLTAEARAGRESTVRIEDNVYIGPGVIILPNVTIGQGAVVSAGSVVSRSIPPHTLVRGNPAEPIANCGVSLGGGVSYEEFVRNLKPLQTGEKK